MIFEAKGNNECLGIMSKFGDGPESGCDGLQLRKVLFMEVFAS